MEVLETRLPTLPNELLDGILSYLPSAQGYNNDLLSCSRVCSTFEALTLRRRFHSVAIDCNDEDQRIPRAKERQKGKTLSAFLELLDTSPRLVPQIKNLCLVHPCERQSMEEDEEYDPYRSAVYCPTINILLLSAILQRLSHLRQLELRGVLFKRPLSRSSYDLFAGLPPLELHLDKLRIDFGECQSLRIHNVCDILDILALIGSSGSSIGELHLSNFECMFSGPPRAIREFPRVKSLTLENIFPAHAFLRACATLNAAPSRPHRYLQKLDVACRRLEDLVALVEVVNEPDVREGLTHLALTLDEIISRNQNDHDPSLRGLNLSLLPNLQSLVLRFRMATWCTTGDYNRRVWTRVSRILSTLIPSTPVSTTSCLALRRVTFELSVNGATAEHFLPLEPLLGQIDDTLIKVRTGSRAMKASSFQNLVFVHRKSTLVESGDIPREQIEKILPRLMEEGMLHFED